MRSLSALILSLCFTFNVACSQEGEAPPNVLEQMEAWESLLPSEFSTKSAREKAIATGDDYIILTRAGEDGGVSVARLVVIVGDDTRFEYLSTVDLIRQVNCKASADIIRPTHFSKAGGLD